MLIDLHAHTSGISRCCRIPIPEVLRQTLDNGMDGIVLTNHYQKSYIQDGRFDEFIQKYIDEFHATKAYGDATGCTVLFGIEVTMERYPKVHMLIYGADPEFLKENPRLFDCTQEELYALVKAEHALLIQAHPFRNGTTVLDPDFLDGVEISCHPLYGNSYTKELLAIAEKENLIVTCGGDFHADTYRPKCGMFLPDGIRDHIGLRDYLLSSEETKLCIQEPNADTCEVISLKRSKTI